MFNAHNSFPRQNAHSMSLGSITVTTPQWTFLLFNNFQYFFTEIENNTFVKRRKFSLSSFSVKISFGNSYQPSTAITSICKLRKWLEDSVQCGCVSLWHFLRFFCQMLKLSVHQGARKIERRKERKKEKQNDTKKGNGKKYEEENGKEERKM